MVTVTEFDAAERLEELIELAESGERVSITRHGRPIAALLVDEPDGKLASAAKDMPDPPLF